MQLSGCAQVRTANAAQAAEACFPGPNASAPNSRDALHGVKREIAAIRAAVRDLDAPPPDDADSDGMDLQGEDYSRGKREDGMGSSQSPSVEGGGAGPSGDAPAENALQRAVLMRRLGELEERQAALQVWGLGRVFIGCLLCLDELDLLCMTCVHRWCVGGWPCTCAGRSTCAVRGSGCVWIRMGCRLNAAPGYHCIGVSSESECGSLRLTAPVALLAHVRGGSHSSEWPAGGCAV